MSTLRDLPIKQKLLAITMITIAVSLLLAGAGIIISDRILFRAGMERDLLALASIIGDNSTAALAFDDPRAAGDVLDSLKERPHVVSACIYKPDGGSFASYARTGAGGACPGPGQADEITSSSRGLTLSHPILLANRRVGTLVMLYDPTELTERTRLYIEIVLGILLAVSLLAFVLSSRLREIIATPISRLADAATSVSQNADYSVRVEKYSQDELGVLVDAFNHMLERVQLRDIEVQTARNSLQTTLTSIGDAVISTDNEGRIVFTNPIARKLLRWPEPDLAGQHIDDVFRIVNEFTRQKGEVPVHRVLREGAIVGLANHTILIARDGTEVPIDDSAAPIRDAGGRMRGVVLVFRDITERRRAETSARLLASIVESSDDAIISSDLEGFITSWNKGAESIFGYAADETIGKPISILAAPGRPDEIPELLEHIKRGDAVEHLQTLRRAKGGRLVHASITMSPVRDASGQVVGASKVSRDITAQVEAQAQIAEQRERLRVTLSSIGDAVMATDASGRVSYLNPIAEQLTGWTSPEAEDRPLEEVFRIINEESRQTVENPVARVLREGKIVGLANHTLLIARDGREIAIDDSAAPIRSAQGELSGVVLVFRDVSEKRSAERLAAERTAELRQRAQLMRGVPCFVRNIEDSMIIYWNPGAAELYQYSAEEAIGRSSHSLLKTVFPAPLDELRKTLFETGQWSGELIQERRDGSHVTVASHWAVHRDENDEPVAILEVNTDITERKRLDQQQLELATRERELAAERILRETEAELARVVRALSVGELATSIAHEINQPLAGIVTNAEAAVRWLSAGKPNIEEAKESLALIARDGKRAGAVIHRIREFLRKGRQEAMLLDINDIVHEAVALARPGLLKRTVTLSLELPGDATQVRGDRIQLQQVILNLIMNGAEAMSSQEGMKGLQVTVRKTADDNVLVAVSDAGVGIGPEDMAHMFDPFFTTKPAGMGMGLSISRTIIEAHGGRIWAELNDDRGLTVQFVLPAEGITQSASNGS